MASGTPILSGEKPPPIGSVALADVSQHVELVNAFLRERPHP
jgi:hypothetical protein